MTTVRDADFLFPLLLSQRDHFRFGQVRGETVELTVPWIPFHHTEAKGERVFTLDISKDFMPIHGTARWQAGSEWRTETFEVKASELVGDVWMPTEIREVVQTPRGEKRGAANVWDTKADAFEQGSVTAADVVVLFPKGTRVVNAINGVIYTVE